MAAVVFLDPSTLNPQTGQCQGQVFHAEKLRALGFTGTDVEYARGLPRLDPSPLVGAAPTLTPAQLAALNGNLAGRR
jgi:hypothetical protein